MRETSLLPIPSNGDESVNWKKLYPSFVVELESIGVNVDRLELLQRLQIWLKSSLGKWRPEIRTRYGLDEYATLDLSRFPVNEASLSPAEEVPRILAVPPASVEGFAGQVSEVFWQGITVESPIVCPICNYLQLRILEDPLTKEAMFACDQCAWAQTENGDEWQHERFLKPATTEVVARWRCRNA